MNRFLFLTSVAAVVLLFGSCRKADIGNTATCSFSVVDNSLSHPKNSEFKAILEKYRKKGLPGISALVEDENGIWFSSTGFADIQEQTPFLPCNPSKAASITKLMVGTLVFMLQEEGKLHTNDLLSQYLSKELLKDIENADKVTIKQCMQHTTGIYDIISDSEFYLAVLNNPNKRWESEELLKFVRGKKAGFAPGDTSEYSNTNTLLVSMVLDKILGYSHAIALREKIWNPLGMKSTYYQSKEELPANTAQGYYDLYNNGSIVNVSNLITGSGNGYGGVFSTVFDLHAFIKALYYDKLLISQASLNEMQTFRAEDEKTDCGVGMLRKFKNFSTHLGIGHSGRDLGYSADLFLFPTRNNRLMIFFVNYGTNGNTKLREVFWEFEEELVNKILE